MAKAKATLVSLVVFCEKLAREVTVKLEDAYFTSSENECELCGSHGSVVVSVGCKCGKTHKIEIRSW